jgi:tetratricopeptide (TPR) repeat protein
MAGAVALMARQARRAGLSGQFEDGHRILDEAEDLAGSPGDRARIAIERGRLENSAGSPQSAVPFFLDAWNKASAAGDHDLAVDASHMLAIVCDLEIAEQWTAKAFDYIDSHFAGDHWRGVLHHNIGWTYFEANRFDDALESFRKDEAIRMVSGPPQTVKIARYAIVRTLRAMGRRGEAVELGERVVKEAEVAGDRAPYICEELAECHAALGNAQKAALFAKLALDSLENDPSFARNEPERLNRLVTLAGLVEQ